MDNSISPSDDTTASCALLKCLETLVNCERNLTKAVTRTLPLLPAHVSPTTSQLEARLATPQNMTQVAEILSYARTLAPRTSAPSGWNPMLPMIGFATPNPLPHQIRGGCLGAMQLQMAKEERSAASRAKVASPKPQQPSAGEDQDRTTIEATGASVDPETLARMQADRKERAKRLAAEDERRRKKAREEEEAKQRVTMNLSESSSSEDDDDDEEDSEEE